MRESNGLCTTVMTSTLRFAAAGLRRLAIAGAVITAMTDI
jgi:hypothetical protein